MQYKQMKLGQIRIRYLIQSKTLSNISEVYGRNDLIKYLGLIIFCFLKPL